MAESPGRWNFNAQTIIGIITIAGLLVAWGAMLNTLQKDTGRNSENIGALTLRLERNDSATALLDTRVAALEKVAVDALMLRRELETTISGFQRDIAVIREILQRMDNQNKDPRP
jgi:hypothetical protein